MGTFSGTRGELGGETGGRINMNLPISRRAESSKWPKVALSVFGELTRPRSLTISQFKQFKKGGVGGGEIDMWLCQTLTCRFYFSRAC